MSSKGISGLAFDSDHCRAICDEIGARLGIVMNRDVSAIPAHLLNLMEQFANLDHLPAPSIVPSDDIDPSRLGVAVGCAASGSAKVKSEKSFVD